MAELRVERKRPNIWRWIVLLLVIALLTWALLERTGRTDGEVTDPVGIGMVIDPGPDFLAIRIVAT